MNAGRLEALAGARSRIMPPAGQLRPVERDHLRSPRQGEEEFEERPNPQYARPVGEYLRTSCRPDCEYIDGELRERRTGETDHSRLQMLVSRYLSNRERQWGIIVLPEQRVQVKANRYRVPDIVIARGSVPTTPILHEPPFLCIEILSCEDSMRDMQERIEDYRTSTARTACAKPKTVSSALRSPTSKCRWRASNSLTASSRRCLC